MATMNMNDMIKKLSWLSFFLFFVTFVLFFVAYTGHSWFVQPKDELGYPPDSRSPPINFGLFWMCAYGHCKYDLRIDYMVVQYLPNKSTQDAYQNYRTACMAIITVAAILVLAAFALNFIILAGFKFSPYIGFICGVLQVLIFIIILIGVSLFGNKFRGTTSSMPFGWSFWMMVACMILFLLDAGCKLLLAVLSVLFTYRKKQQTTSAARPLAYGY